MTFGGRRELKNTSLCLARNTKKNLFARDFSSRALVPRRKPLTQRMICGVACGRKKSRNK
jgi:hypothetical protein